MKTVLFFVSSTRHSCFGRLDGVLRYATKHGWHVQVVERAFHKVDIRETLRFWTPDGIIAECGSGAEELNRRAFGKLPVVYFDRDPKLCRNEMSVRLDSEEVGRMAARELLSLGLDNFAFVPFRLPMYWNEARARSFERDVKAAGKRFFRFGRPCGASPAKQRDALERWLEELPKPCGIFAANDYVSEEVVTAATRLKIAMPSRLAVIGVDNDEQICERSSPPLSSIAPDFADGGYLAAKLLGQMMGARSVRPCVHTFAASCVVRRKSTRFVGRNAPMAKTGAVARGRDFIQTDAGKGIGVMDVVRRMGVIRCTAETLFKRETGKTILQAINDRIYELARAEFAKDHPPVKVVAERLAVSRNTLDRIFIRRTGRPAGRRQVAAILQNGEK